MFRGPAEHAAGFGGVADEQIDLRGPHQRRIDDHVLLPVEPRVAEGDLAELADGVGLARSDDVIVGPRLLEHQPHRLHVVARESPIALGIEIPQPQLLRAAGRDSRDRIGDLARDELLAAPRRLVIEEDARAGEDPVRLAIVDGDVVCVRLGHAVRAARMERRELVLRCLADLAVHLGRRRLVELDGAIDHADRFEQARGAEPGHLAGEDRLLPGCRHERHRREVIDLVGIDVVEQCDQRELVEQVAFADLDAVAQVGDALERFRRRAAGHAHDVVALLEQEFGEIGPVLSGDAGDEGPALSWVSHAMILADARARFTNSFSPGRVKRTTRVSWSVDGTLAMLSPYAPRARGPQRPDGGGGGVCRAARGRARRGSPAGRAAAARGDHPPADPVHGHPRGTPARAEGRGRLVPRRRAFAPPRSGRDRVPRLAAGVGHGAARRGRARRRHDVVAISHSQAPVRDRARNARAGDRVRARVAHQARAGRAERRRARGRRQRHPPRAAAVRGVREAGHHRAHADWPGFG